MPILFLKKKIDSSVKNYAEVEYLFGKISEELGNTQAILKDLNHQIKFFGTSPKLENEKEDIILLLDWLKMEFRELQDPVHLLH